jgi:dCTP deaminase
LIASSKTINDKLDDGDVQIERTNGGDLAVEPSSIDLHLGDELLRMTGTDRVVVDDESTYPEHWPTGTMEVPSGEFRLAHTDEVLALPDEYVGVIHGRSSVGRLGLFIENAGLVDAGFNGQITLELYNPMDYDIVLKEDMRICQMTLHSHENPPDVAYSRGNSNKYNGQMGATPSRLHEDF